MTWSESDGRVSRAFDEWKLVDRDHRAFLRLGLSFAEVEYARLWKEAGEEPYWDGRPEQLDSFEDKIHGLWEHDYTWMHLAGVLRDSVSNFEVYLEKAREEVLAHQGQPLLVSSRSPNWEKLKAFFNQLGGTIETTEVKDVRELRHFLTHRRGELRTEELRAQFQATHSDVIPPFFVELTQDRVLEAMDKLAAAAREIDARVYRYSWGREALPNLTP